MGTDSWTFRTLEASDSASGKRFVGNFTMLYQEYPSSTAAGSYDIVFQWADVSRSKTTDASSVIGALENTRYKLLKDEQFFRALNHQNLQSMYVVRVKSRKEVMLDPLKQDYFEVLHWMEGDVAAPREADVELERSSVLKY